jgi:hypothetical protein
MNYLNNRISVNLFKNISPERKVLHDIIKISDHNGDMNGTGAIKAPTCCCVFLTRCNDDSDLLFAEMCGFILTTNFTLESGSSIKI